MKWISCEANVHAPFGLTTHLRPLGVEELAFGLAEALVGVGAEALRGLPPEMVMRSQELPAFIFAWDATLCSCATVVSASP